MTAGRAAGRRPRSGGPRALVAIAGLLSVGLATVVAASGGPARITADDQRSVVIATLPCDTRIQSVSTGFVLDDRLVVTVAHAIYGTRDFAVLDARGVWHDADVWRLDLERDLAVVRVERLRAGPMDIGSPVAGAPIRLLDGAASGAVDGVVMRAARIRTAEVGHPDRSSTRQGYELELPIATGDSGSAVVDDRGRLVGVVFARSTARSGVSWATAANEVERVLQTRGSPGWECQPDPGARLVRAVAATARGG